MVCTHCGSALDREDRFCARCGAPTQSATGTISTGGPDDAVRERLAAGDKIGAIKLYRQATGIGLAEAKAAVDAIESGAGAGVSRPGAGAAVGAGGLDDRVRALLLQGEKMGAIRLYRQETGRGLEDAKNAVESLAAGLPPGALSASGGVRATLGCGSTIALAGVAALGLFQIATRDAGHLAPSLELASIASQSGAALGEPIAAFVLWSGQRAACGGPLSEANSTAPPAVVAAAKDGFEPER